MRFWIFVVAIFSTGPALSQSTTSPLVSEDFENLQASKKYWRVFQYGGGVRFDVRKSATGSDNHYGCLTKDRAGGGGYYQTEVRGISGRLRISAMVSANDVEMNYGLGMPAGQFQGVYMENGKETGWIGIKADLFGKVPRQKFSFETNKLVPSQAFKIRIGLEEGTGELCFDDIVVEIVQ